MNASHLKKILGVFAFLYLPILVILVLIKVQDRVPIYYLTLDPIAVGNEALPFYTGALSNIGILFWCAATTVCWFCFALLLELKAKQKLQIFFLASGALTALLLFDDLFVLHSIGFPQYLKIPEGSIVFIYLGIVIVYLTIFHRIILSTENISFTFALIFFLLSILLDKEVFPLPDRWFDNGNNLLLEDGFKILGIVSWFYYFVQLGITEIKKVYLDRYIKSRKEY
ncbi:hypothetical protein PMG71_19655 [Roseofilum sp. BLCC_M154]|uniref:Uncharacterized protein n=1 Tax=Roseofilum acuticapitatum BLCC-M154 TaxID=3022444 RepID=A0ABT7AYI5_9CYAN|nr:hypothetical protein [Roseofilum acuticapitatum]MDJ1171652.1 hypothetical protein [Roseofilum acuticapitatum BLCC-M154]